VCSEFELVLACLRWPPAFVDSESVRRLASADLDWTYLLEIVNHHKVAPLVYRNLEAFAADRVPQAPMKALAALYQVNAEAARRRAEHLSTLKRSLDGVDFRILKGIPLAITAFQDVRLRDTGDIDVLIRESDIFAAEDALQKLGYTRTEPQARLTPRRLASYLRHQKDFAYEHKTEDLAIDLHWRLFRNPFLPSNARLEEVGGERDATLATPRHLLYLCVHGALDGWLRLKWLADISTLLRVMDATELTETLRLAREENALPAVSAACLLCHDLLGNAVPAACLDRSEPRVARILSFSRRALASNGYRPLREGIPSQQWFLNEFRMHGSLRYRLNLVARSLFRPRTWLRFDLPDMLFPLYAVLSPIEWILFHLRAADLILAIEAGCMLTFFRIALNFLPVQRLTAWMSRGNAERVWVSQERAAGTIRRIEWSIDTVTRHTPFSFVCFPQCLAAYFMLRRRHVASRLFYGVAREADELKTHTWVKVGDRTVVGGNVESQFTVLASFP
jgi:hypothetical protein